MSSKVNLCGLQIDSMDTHQAVYQLLEWVDQPGACRFVVTPNVDHVVMFQQNAQLRAAYADAGLVLADGMPIVWASRLLRRGVRERVAGSDLVPALFEAADRRGSLGVFLLGAAPGVADRAAANIAGRWPKVQVVGSYSPPIGFEHDRRQNETILSRIAEARPQVLIIGLGAPKQELWVHAHSSRIEAPVALCVGATIDFLAGEKSRAPRWMRKTGLEWVHRLACEPRRLAKRYARDAWIFPQLLWRDLQRSTDFQ